MKSAMILSALSLLLCIQGLAATPVPPAPYLLFSNWFTVTRANLDGSGYTEFQTAHPQAVDYHYWKDNGLVFWNDHVEGTIHQADIGSESSSTILPLQRLNLPSGLAVDWVNDKLYYSYSDDDSTTNAPTNLAVYDLETGEVTDLTPTVLQQERRDTPRSPYTMFFDLAVDPNNQKLYWTTGIQLLRSSLDGDNVEILHVSQCSARYIGLSGNKLFYNQDPCGRFEGIQYIDLDTGNVNILVQERGYYNDVTAFGDTVYWSSFGRIYSVPLSGGPTSEVLRNYDHGVAQFRGLTVVHPSLQPLPEASE